MSEYYENSGRETVMAKGGYKAKPGSVGYGGDIVGILISIFLIVGGLSGRMVLRFTDSSPALVVAGFLFLAWDIFSLVRKKKTLAKSEEEYYAFSSKMSDQEKAVEKDERKFANPVMVRISVEKNISVLDFGPRLNGFSMNRDVKAREYTGGSSRVHNILNFSCLDLNVVFDIEPDTSEVIINMFRSKEGIGITLPRNVKVIASNQE